MSFDERLRTMRPLLEIVASERQADRSDQWDDIVQEGLIAAWQAMERHPDKPERYYRAAGKFGVHNLLRGRTPFGGASRQGKTDSHTAAGPLVVVDKDGFERYVVEPASASAEEVYLAWETVMERLAA